jgi:hypothetical protein
VKAEGDLRWVSQQRTVLEVFALTVCQPDQGDDAQSLRVRVSDLERQLALIQLSPPPPTESKSVLKTTEKPQASISEPQAKESAQTPDSANPVEEQVSDSESISPKQAWNAMLKRASRELPSVYSMMSEGKFGGFRDGSFYLSFPADKQFLVGFVMADDRRKQIESILSLEYGQPVRFEAIQAVDPQREIDQKQKAQQDIELLAQVFGRQNLSVKNEL